MTTTQKPIQIYIGKPGSGKSVRIAELICKAVAEGKRSITLDYGRTYQGLVQAVAGGVVDAKNYRHTCSAKTRLIEFEGSSHVDCEKLALAQADLIFIDEAFRVIPVLGDKFARCLNTWLSAGSQVVIASQSMRDLHGIPEELLAKTQITTLTRK